MGNVKNSIIMDNTFIDEDSVVEDSVIEENVRTLKAKYPARL